MPDNSEENLAAAEVVVAPTVENGQQINVNKDVVDNTYEIYIYNAKEPSTNKNASNSKSRLVNNGLHHDQESNSQQIYENFTSSRQQPGSQQQHQQNQQIISTKATIESQPQTKTGLPEDNTENKNNIAAFQREGSFVLQREGSFVRTIRKLPLLPMIAISMMGGYGF